MERARKQERVMGKALCKWTRTVNSSHLHGQNMARSDLNVICILDLKLDPAWRRVRCTDSVFVFHSAMVSKISSEKQPSVCAVSRNVDVLGCGDPMVHRIGISIIVPLALLMEFITPTLLDGL